MVKVSDNLIHFLDLKNPIKTNLCLMFLRSGPKNCESKKLQAVGRDKNSSICLSGPHMQSTYAVRLRDYCVMILLVLFDSLCKPPK